MNKKMVSTFQPIDGINRDISAIVVNDSTLNNKIVSLPGSRTVTMPLPSSIAAAKAIQMAILQFLEQLPENDGRRLAIDVKQRKSAFWL